MISHASLRFWRLYAKLPDRQKDRAKGAYRLFANNPNHPSLHFKPVSDGGLLYSARISLGYRALGILERDIIVWFFIGNHDEYMRAIERFG